MKSYINSLLMVVFMTFLLGSCNKATKIDVSKDKVSFSKDGGERSINVNADGGFDISDSPDWVKTELDDAVLKITVDENTTGSMRECSINLVGDNVTIPIDIKQAYICTYITVTDTVVTLPKEGGSKELIIDTDGDAVAVQATDGIKADINGDKLTINAPANPKGKIEGQLILRCDDVKTVVNVIVQGAICGQCDGTGKITCPKCGGKGGDGPDGSAEIYYGCSKCGGYGYYWPGEYVDGHPGSGKVICPDCGGAGH